MLEALVMYVSGICHRNLTHNANENKNHNIKNQNSEDLIQYNSVKPSFKEGMSANSNNVYLCVSCLLPFSERGIICPQEALLTESDLPTFDLYCDQWEALLQCPGVHDSLDIKLIIRVPLLNMDDHISHLDA